VTNTVETKPRQGIAVLGRYNIGTSATLLAIVVILFVFLSLTSAVFPTPANLSNLLRQTSINGIIALGMLMVIITAGIDLSVGAVVAIAGIVNALMLQAGMSMWVSIPLTLIIGAAIGVFNGILVHEVSITPFIATLGTLTIVRGLVMIMSGARMVANLPKEFGQIASGDLFGIPSMFIIWMVLFLATLFLLNYTQLGRNFFIIGSSKEVARLSGIRLRSNMYAVYGLSSLYAALAGILLSSRLSMGVPTAGISYELDAIAAVVIGGTSLAGGTGAILGTVIGTLIIGTMNNGLDLLNVSSYFQQIVKGIIIISAVLLDQYTKNAR